MARLTPDERRRAHERRGVGATARTPRAVTLEQMEDTRGDSWRRNARIATLVTVAAGGLLAVIQLAQTFQGPGSMLDWLLPRI